METGKSHRAKIAILNIVFSAFILMFGMVQAAHSKTNKKISDHVSGEIVFKIRDSAMNVGTRASVLTKLQAALGDHSIVDIRLFKTDSSLHTVRLANDKDVPAALRQLLTDSSVEIAEPNYVYNMFEDGAPNDPDFGKLWGLKNMGQADSAGQLGKTGADINVLPLWKDGIVGDQKTLVAIIDTGVSWDHPDLMANLYTNKGESGDKSNNGKDDDGNGFIDDIHGWNFANNSNKSMDDHNHGSHCSGTIGAVGNNSKGVAGVNWNVSLLPIKFLTAEGSGSLEGAVNAINYARLMKAQIMSNSWGGGGQSELMKEAIVKAKDAGILFVAAAGNEKSNNDTKPTYPASYEVENVVAVAAIDNQEKLA
ncbi:MAG: S8 family peptidase, partial [Bdellovibrionota bacterium]